MSIQNVHVVELRSDTFTQPNGRMREAMKNAEVGDSSYNEDPTTNKLQDEIAKLLGTETALFFPSGTMSNLAAIMSHCYERGCEVIIGHKSHYNMWEQGGISQVAGVYVKQIENLEDGTFDLDKLVQMISDDDPGCPRTKVVCLENTQNFCGGRILPFEFIEKVASICKTHNMKLHLDGSRIMNAAVALNIDVKEICKYFDSINFCCSKGLGAPVGSLLAGSNEFMQRAYRARQVLGGSLRQSGVLTAAALVGLDEMYEKLAVDHKNAKFLAEGLVKHSNGLIDVKAGQVETNIILARITDTRITTKALIKRMNEVTEDEMAALNANIIVKLGYVDKSVLRVITHCDVNEESLRLALKKLDYISKNPDTMLN